MEIKKTEKITNSTTNYSIESGLRDQDGGLHYFVSGPKGTMILNLSTFEKDEKAVFASLHKIGIIMLTIKSKNEFKRYLEKITEFKDAIVATQPGFVHPSVYVHGNGETTQADNGIVPPIISFDPDDRYSTRGRSNKWSNGLSELIEGNNICAFLLCYGFLPFLLKLSPLKFNPTLELISPPEFGKSGACAIPASIYGGDPDSDNGLAISWNMTNNAYLLFRRMASDSLFYVDESNMQSEDLKQSGQVSFVQSSTGDKARFTTGAKVEKPVWCALLSNGNEHPAERFKGNGDTLKASETRRITLILDKPILSIKNWEKVRMHVDNHYGWASRRYAKKIVNACAKDEEKFKQRISVLMQNFKRTIDYDAVTSQRTLDVCALTYAAGELARKWKILPAKCMNPKRAVSQIYKKVVSDQHKLKPKSAKQIILRILKEQKNNIKLCKSNNQLSKQQDENSVFSYAVKQPDGGRILYCHAGKLRCALGTDHRNILQELRNIGLLFGEGGKSSKLTTKPPRYIGFTERVYKLKISK